MIKSCVLEVSIPVTEDQWSHVLEIVLDLAKNKVWLREECGSLLYSNLPLLYRQRKAFAQTLINKFLQPEAGLCETPEGVAIWLQAQDQSSDLELPKGIWQHQNVLNSKESIRLTQIILESSKQSEGPCRSSSKAVWRPKVHFVWEAILSRLLNPPKESKHKLLTLDQFWKRAVDGESYCAHR